MTPRTRQFMQVDVFPSAAPLSGNPVAVVLDSEGLLTETMQKFASWTNLSETTFVLPPTDPNADYKLRIFTPSSELLFAGHPTLGSCKAWLEAGGRPKNAGLIVQECGVGLVKVRLDSSTGRLSFAAPAFRREGDLSPDDLKILCDAMGIGPNDVLASRWIDNGPGWAGLILKSVEDVLAVQKDRLNLAINFNWGIIGAYERGQDQLRRGLRGHITPTDPNHKVDDAAPHFELRAFAPKDGVMEDPVCGSLNAGVARWLISAGLAPQSYVASQGACLGREGRIYVSADTFLGQGGEIWVGGSTQVCITGKAFL